MQDYNQIEQQQPLSLQDELQLSDSSIGEDQSSDNSESSELPEEQPSNIRQIFTKIFALIQTATNEEVTWLRLFHIENCAVGVDFYANLGPMPSTIRWM